ncbi:unnamed protein product, partial [Ectocarpus sp. 12 AP-2014]
SRRGTRGNPTLFYYPLEATARDRVPIDSVDITRTQPMEWLNDNLVNVGLRSVGVCNATSAAVVISLTQPQAYT